MGCGDLRTQTLQFLEKIETLLGLIYISVAQIPDDWCLTWSLVISLARINGHEDTTLFSTKQCLDATKWRYDYVKVGVGGIT